MRTVALDSRPAVAEVQIAGIVDYLSQASARHLVAELRARGDSEAEVARKLRLATELLGWGV